MHHRAVGHRTLLRRHVRWRRKQQPLELRIDEIVRQRPGKPAEQGSAEITVRHAQAHLQALRHLALAQPLSEPQAQCLAYLPR